MTKPLSTKNYLQIPHQQRHGLPIPSQPDTEYKPDPRLLEQDQHSPQDDSFWIYCPPPLIPKSDGKLKQTIA